MILAAASVSAQAPDPADGGLDASADAGDAGDAGEGGDAAPRADDELLPAIVELPAEPLDLVVGVAGSEPFVIVGDGRLRGISIETWEKVASELNIRYEYRPYPNALSLVNAVARGDVDVGVGPLSITSERASRVSFTQPHFSGSLSIAARPAERGIFGHLSPLFRRAFLTGLAILLLVLTFVGVLFWLAERRANPEHFPPSPLSGIGNGVWLAVVTMTTVGYGDRSPMTPLGRVIAGVWMLIALLTTSSLTAFLATALTLSTLDHAAIDTIEDLEGKRVAVPRGTAAVPFVRRHGGRVVEADSVQDAMRLANEGEVAATVFDTPVLAYELTQHPDLALVLSQHSYEDVGYGFAVAIGSEFEELIDMKLLKLRESAGMDVIRTGWLGP